MSTQKGSGEAAELITLAREKLAFDRSKAAESYAGDPELIRIALNGEASEHARTKPITEALLKVAEASLELERLPDSTIAYERWGDALAELEKAVRGE